MPFFSKTLWILPGSSASTVATVHLLQCFLAAAGKIQRGLIGKCNFGIINELTRYGQFILKLFQQYLGSETPVEVLGEEGKDIFPQGVSRSHIMGSYYVTANMAAQQMARELDAELNVQLYQMFVSTQNPFLTKSMSSFYDMTKDVMQSVGKRNKSWLKPFEFYKNPDSIQQPGQAGGLTPEEQQFMTELINAGVPMEVARQKLEELRSGVAPDMQAEVQSAEQTLLTQGGGVAA